MTVTDSLTKCSVMLRLLKHKLLTHVLIAKP